MIRELKTKIVVVGFFLFFWLHEKHSVVVSVCPDRTCRSWSLKIKTKQSHYSLLFPCAQLTCTWVDLDTWPRGAGSQSTFYYYFYYYYFYFTTCFLFDWVQYRYHFKHVLWWREGVNTCEHFSLSVHLSMSSCLTVSLSGHLSVYQTRVPACAAQNTISTSLGRR